MTRTERRIGNFLFSYPVCFLWPLWAPLVFLYLTLHPKFYRLTEKVTTP